MDFLRRPAPPPICTKVEARTQHFNFPINCIGSLPSTRGPGNLKCWSLDLLLHRMTWTGISGHLWPSLAVSGPQVVGWSVIRLWADTQPLARPARLKTPLGILWEDWAMWIGCQWSLSMESAAAWKEQSLPKNTKRIQRDRWAMLDLWIKRQFKKPAKTKTL